MQAAKTSSFFTISELLAGKRRLSLRHIERLATFFKVRPSLLVAVEPASGQVSKRT
jgi:antitoxin component HigA of HigAB toxin-antitoxin module